MDKNYLILFIFILALVVSNCMSQKEHMNKNNENMAVVKAKVFLKGDPISEIFEFKKKAAGDNPLVEKYMNGKYTLKYYVSREVSAKKNYRSVTKMDLHPTRISEPYHKSSKTSKSNRQGRKHHHIHQPGRTNCTQRYQRK